MNDTDIAVVGMASVFPGSNNYNEYWENIINGVSSIKEIDSDRWDINKFYSSNVGDKNKANSKWCGLIEKPFDFDNGLFNISPREAERMEPQQRLLLQETWHCIEDSGISLEKLQKSKTAVFVGELVADYKENLQSDNLTIDGYFATGSYSNMLSNRISYIYDLKGESLSVNAACASTLSALNLAINSLNSGEADYAIVGACNLNLNPWKYISLSKARMLSPIGKCMTFDKNANGYVPGDGIGVLIIQRAKDAIKDRNNIHGLIKGVYVAHNGKSKSITAPKIEAQQEVISKAYNKAKVSPETIGYVEAHGTGTSLGDPIEIQAITKAFREFTDKNQFCRIGSVKTNIGHLEAAAGMASLIKVLLMLKNKKIPPSLNVTEINPMIDFENSPFIFNGKLMEWERNNNEPLRAGVSSFGFGGVNSHVVLEEYISEKNEYKEEEVKDGIIIFSANSKKSLEGIVEQFNEKLDSQSNIIDIMKTNFNINKNLKYRVGISFKDKEELIRKLSEKEIFIEETIERNKYCLVLDEISSNNITEFIEIKDKFYIMKKHYDRVMEIAKSINKNTTNIMHFALNYSFARCLEELGVQVSLTASNKSSVWVSIALSEVLSINDIILILTGEKIIEEVNIELPKRNLFDNRSKEIIYSLNIDAIQVKRIIDEIKNKDLSKEDKEAFHFYMNKGKVLYKNQYTFKSYVNEWDYILEKSGYEKLSEFINNEVSEDINKNKMKFLFLIIIDCIKKLDRKWGLNTIKKIDDKEVNIVLRLYEIDVLDENDIINIFNKGKLDFNKFREKVERIYSINEEMYIATKGFNSNSSKDIMEYIKNNKDTVCLKEDEMYKYIRSSDFATNGFQVSLLKLWLEGMDIKFHKLYKEKTYNKQSLVRYCFDKKRYKINGKIPKQEGENKVEKVVLQQIMEIISDITEENIKDIDIDEDFLYIGIDSIAGVELVDEINEKFNIQLSQTVIFEYSTIKKLAEYISKRFNIKVDNDKENHKSEAEIYEKIIEEKKDVKEDEIENFVCEDTDIAVIGMSGKFANADNIYEYWDKLYNGQSMIRKVPKDRWDIDEYYDIDKTVKGKCNSKWGGFINKVDEFDASFFNISPKEAIIMDPQQRIILEECFNALEDAAYSKEELDNLKCGVYLGVVTNDYREMLLDAEEYTDEGLQILGNANSVLSARIAYLLNLKGPAVAIDTACSSSLVSIHLACQSILSGETDMMLAGGVTLYLKETPYIQLTKLSMLSKDGQCKTFDNAANGFVPGEAAGVVVLKKLDKAIEDGDNIYGVIKASGANQDGKTNGIMAPSKEAQRELEEEVYKKAKINEGDITYVEAHGTGTKLGDPIEIEALSESFGKMGNEKNYCAIGSVKTNIGHALGAAGIAAFVKTMLCLKYKKLVPTLNFKNKNEFIDFENSPFYLLKNQEDWKVGRRGKRMAAISSFGFSGTNCHIVVEEAPIIKNDVEDKPYYFIPISATNEKSLIGNIKEFLNWLDKEGVNKRLSDIEYTLAIGRTHFKKRYSCIVKNKEELIKVLKESLIEENILKNIPKSEEFNEETLRNMDALNNERFKEVLLKLSSFYNAGNDVELNLLYVNKKLRKISMPTYSYNKNKYFLKRSRVNTKKERIELKEENNNKFSFNLNCNALKDHRVGGKAIMPGTTIIVTAIKAAKAVLGENYRCLEDISFQNVASLNNVQLVEIKEKENSYIYEMNSNTVNGEYRISQGKVKLRESNYNKSEMNLESIKNRCIKPISMTEVYSILNKVNLEYGEEFQIIKQISFNDKEVVSKLRLSDKLIESKFKYTDVLLDGALQTAAVLLANKYKNESVSFIPYSVKEVCIYKDIPKQCNVYANINDNQKDSINALLVDSDGEVCAEFKQVKIHVKLKKENVNITSNIDTIKDEMKSFLKETIAKEIQCEIDEIEDDASFKSFGINSIMSMSLVKEMENKIGTISKTIFYEVDNIDELVEYIMENNNEYVYRVFGSENNIIEENNDEYEIVSYSKENYTNPNEEVAIVGVSGIYPKAKDIYELWENIRNKKDCVTEVPEERWDHSKFFSNNKNEVNKAYSKWGGFIEDYDKFDPLFFNISPREAKILDPQERLLLEIVWHLMEDSGYTKSELDGRNIGVYVGAMYSHYQYYGVLDKYNQTSYGTTNASIANRISYFFNLKGPCLAIDSMCSSALSALDIACKSIIQRDIEAAIVGGVNLNLHPNKYIALSQRKFLSTDGKCRSFGEGGDGYVPAEAVGAIMLKPLSKAVEDNDYIYGVIKSTAINHGGKTSGFTVPNPKSQEKVIYDTLKKSNIDPRTITYIEAHGTGTGIGDPIEIKGLSNAYKRFTGDKQYCAIGSIKSNIGHAESAAGITSITKVLLQMKNKEILPSIHCKEINKNIDFENTPFYIQKELTKWSRPIILENGVNKVYKRRAGVSAFGAGGSNAHLIIEEYENKKIDIVNEDNNQIIILSAKDNEQLKIHSKNISNYLRNITKIVDEIKLKEELAKIAITLQLEREALDSRMAFVASSIEQVILVLDEYSKNGEIIIDGIFQGNISNKHKLKVLKEKYQDNIERILEDKQYDIICELWTAGVEINWSILHGSNKKQHMKLPLYPFKKERYFPVYDEKEEKLNKLIENKGPNKYSKVFSKEDYFIKEHRVDNKTIVQGLVFVEMAQRFASIEENNNVNSIEEFTWIRPLEVTDKCKVLFEIKNHNNKKEIIIKHEETLIAKAVIPAEKKMSFNNIDLSSLKEQNFKFINVNEFYNEFSKRGIQYDNTLRVIEKIEYNTDFVVSKLKNRDGNIESLMAPILDGAFQSSLMFVKDRDNGEDRYIPFSVDKIQYFKKMPDEVYAYVKRLNSLDEILGKGIIKIDITIVDKNNEIILTMNNVICKSMNHKDTSQKLLVFTNGLEAKEIPLTSLGEKQYNIVLINQEYKWDFLDYCSKNNLSNYIIVTNGVRFTELGHKTFEINQGSYDDYIKLFDELKIQNIRANNILYLWDLFSKDIKDNDKCIDDLFNLYKAILNKYKDEECNLLYAYEKENKIDDIYREAISGFNKTISNECINIKSKTVCVENKGSIYSVFDKFIREISIKSGDLEVYYNNNLRYVNAYKQVDTSNIVNYSFRPRGTYIITGGAGGLGIVFANYIANNSYKPNIILLGRSNLDEKRNKIINDLRNLGADATYYSVNILDSSEVKNVISKIKENSNEINGVIHAAGIIRDALFVNKRLQEFKKVAGVKINGLINIHESLKSENLDFFVTFSSIAAVIGNVGQCDYAYGNSFMDNYISTMAKESSKCKYISIKWPYWNNGGMQVSEKIVEGMEKKFGVTPLETQTGVRALEFALNNKYSEYIVVTGNEEKIRKLLNINEGKKQISEVKLSKNNEKSSVSISYTSEQGKNACKNIVKDILSKVLGIESNKILDETSFDNYGVDSVLTMEITNKLEEVFGTLPKTILFECINVEELSDYLQSNCSHIVDKIVLNEEDSEQRIYESELNNEVAIDSYKSQDKNDSDIAIIGISLKCPQAENKNEFWNNLKLGKDCIEEIPKERWDNSLFYSSEKGEKGKTYNKWGGFIKDVDKFDPIFFDIPPVEAKDTCPQERLFLEESYKALEDSGYTKESLKNSKVGVFVGVGPNQYELIAVEEAQKGNWNNVGLLNATVANRVSYYFDFKGPSIALDTMCSSSLTAIHLACTSIINGESDYALAGGINLLIHPYKYVSFSSKNFFASDGKCRSFGDGGDGYVPGEGVGVLVLKSLDKAIRDGDNIYCTIKGTHIAHNGKTRGYRVPNPKAQAELFSESINKANIFKESIGYIEAHGTGTSLGDPIEIEGINKVFNNSQCEKNSIPIGSVKSNIGHLEAAAAVASITKVILQMKHKELVPSINNDVLNRNIDFSESVVKVQREAEEWKHKNEYVNGERCEIPYVATVSSFGASGSNGHMILEEYIKDNKNLSYNYTFLDNIFVFSAQTNQSLKLYVKDFILFLDEAEDQLKLEDIAYTLKVGREQFENRLVIIASSYEELVRKLKCYLIDMIQDGIFVKDKNISVVTNNNIRKLISKNDISGIAELWVSGAKIDWISEYKNNIRSKVSLPTYHFIKESYWLPVAEKEKEIEIKVDNVTAKSKMDIKLNVLNEEDIKVKTEELIINLFSKIFMIPKEKIDGERLFEDYGIDSILIKKFNVDLGKYIKNISPTILFECSNINTLVNYLIKNNYYEIKELFNSKNEEIDKEEKVNIFYKKQSIYSEEDIAIIGVSGRYPKANNINELWEILSSGKDCVDIIPKDRWNYKDYHDDDINNSIKGFSYCKWGAFIDNPFEFDAKFFKITPSEAEMLDPQERMFLEVAWEVIEDAGYGNKIYESKNDIDNGSDIGVFVGTTSNTYNMWGNVEWSNGMISPPKTFPWSLANRVSYTFNLTGPSMPIDTACSSSLAAIHLACESIKRGECTEAIAGGVNLYLHPSKYIQMCQTRMLSPTGKCHSFGENADGFVPGEGVGALMLKRLSDAENDGDRIYGVIKGSALKHGGYTNGYTVPNPNSQAKVIIKAMEQAGINPRIINHIEAHGTGTDLGDPIEITGLKKAFNKFTNDKQFCAISSIKSNMGHSESEAGIAGITKLLLEMKYKKLVPSLNAEHPNPNIRFEDSPFYIQRNVMDWKQVKVKENGVEISYPRTAGVSSFGAGGVNAHIIIQEYKQD